jgi:predicted small secreted protein
MFEHQDCAPAEKPYVAWLLSLVAVGLLVLSVNACNTMSGMGKDVEAAGGAMHDTADDTKDKMN